MPTHSARLFALTLPAVALCNACASLPTTFPRFEDAQARPAVVVGTIENDRYLDEFKECERPDVICMDPPPLLLTVSISQTVYGSERNGRRYVATTSHYGRGTHLPGSGDVQLLPLKVHGDDLVLPRYAGAAVVRTSSGDLAVPDWGNLPVWWLPCSTMSLREPIEFTDGAARRLEQSDIDELNGLVSVSEGRALPLFGLRVSRIAEHLASISPDVSAMSCEGLSQ